MSTEETANCALSCLCSSVFPPAVYETSCSSTMCQRLVGGFVILFHFSCFHRGAIASPCGLNCSSVMFCEV